jgi:hypothetical protein
MSQSRESADDCRLGRRAEDVEPAPRGTSAIQYLARCGGCCAAVILGLCAVLPVAANAHAAIEGAPVYASTPGLPDGRVYEQVSPADKNGNQAGASTDPFIVGANNHYGYSTPDGDAVEFEGTGAMGESPSGASLYFVATKHLGSEGWSTRSLTPASYEGETGYGASTLSAQFVDIAPSSDLSHAMLEGGSVRLTPPPGNECGGLYLVGPEPLVAATWLLQPHVAGSALCNGEASAPAGGSPNFSTVYFTAAGPLLEEDESRSPEAWGFYEYSEGTLREAGVLPDGGLSSHGAVPAASGHGRARVGNDISELGERAFFVSPDPASCEQNGGQNDCVSEPPELYVREGGTRTSQLISRDTLLPEEHGMPAGAPHGVSSMLNPTFNEQGQDSQSYVFASPDGSQAFFQSTDCLTEGAFSDPVTKECSGAAKTYDFELNTGALHYLPGVTGEILAIDKDGSVIAFVRPEEGGMQAELGLWSTGPAGGSVTGVTELPGGPDSGSGGVGDPARYVSEARLSENGAVLVFTTATSLSTGFNSGGQEEIYRYDASENTLGCVSCAPVGVTPNGPATMSSIEPAETYEFNGGKFNGTVESRGISQNGDRVFFDTPAPLVPQDTNTNAPEVEVAEETMARQGRDVYEWENGVVYLISGGKSVRDAYYLDSSENGDDVFFATTEGLAPGDRDGGYDVYDARVEVPGERPAVTGAPCEVSTCQASTSARTPPVPPLSATFSGPGNFVSEVVSPTPGTTILKVAKCKKGYVKKKSKCLRRKPKKKTKRPAGGPGR